MSQDKQLSRIEEKLNALLEKQGIAVAGYEQSAAKAASRAPRELTLAQQQAIDNAPKHIEAKVMGANPPAGNAPAQAATVPPDAVGNVTIETDEPDGDKKVEIKPASEVKSDQEQPQGEVVARRTSKP